MHLFVGNGLPLTGVLWWPAVLALILLIALVILLRFIPGEKKKARTLAYVFIALLAVTAAGFPVYEIYQERFSEAASEEIIGKLMPQIESSVTDGFTIEVFEEEDNAGDAEPKGDALYHTAIDIDGEEYIGIIVIPELGLELPVNAQWSYPRLRRTPCRYDGSVDTDDFIIMAHNYERHFGNIKTLQPGDEAAFVSATGYETDYEVLEVEILDPYDVADLREGMWDMTLFTCTPGGGQRVVVRFGKC